MLLPYVLSEPEKKLPELTVPPNDEIEAQKFGKAPHLASITPGKNIIGLHPKLWKKCRGGGGIALILKPPIEQNLKSFSSMPSGLF